MRTQFFARAWAVLCGVLMLALPCHAATFAAGVDCGCSKVGDYVLPTKPVDIVPPDAETGLSKDERFHVSVVPQGETAFFVNVEDAFTSAPILQSLQGQSWGFSPDGDRFVIYSKVGDYTYPTVYNLTSPTPTTPVYTGDGLVDGRIAFSPHGRYALELSIPLVGTYRIRVLDAVTGTLLHEREFAFGTPVGLPPIVTQVGSVRVGFGPDATDRSLVYAWIGPSSSPLKNWVLANLSAGPTNGWPDQSTYDFRWFFSPCGDKFLVVQSAPGLGQKLPALFSTLDHASLLADAFPIVDTDFTQATLAQHVLHHGFPDQTMVLGTNAASASCSVPVPSPPVAAFVFAGPPRLNGVPVPFSDQSSTPSGTSLASRRWTFGDGTVSYETHPSHAFLAPGTYSVTLTVTNSAGRADTVVHDVTIGQNQPPVASFTYSPGNPASRDQVTFTDTSTDDDRIAAVYWALGGASASGSVVTVKACPPTLSVHLTVQDSIGQYGEASLDLPITGSAEVPLAAGGDLQAAIDGACPGNTVALAPGSFAGGVLTRNVNIRGAGAGVSVIDGAGVDGWVVQLLPEWSDAPEDVSLSDLTVTGGVKIVGPDGQIGGGGVYHLGNGSTALTRVEVSGNAGKAGLYGYNNNGPSVVTDSSFHDNEGPGLSFNVGSAQIRGCTFARNEVGVVFDETADVVVANSDFHDNRGPALWLNGTESTVWSSRFFGNNTVGGLFAVGLRDSSVEFAGNLVAENHAGGLSVDSRTRVSDSTIANNCGAGLHTADGHLYNTILFGNALDLDGTLADDIANLVGVDPAFSSAGDFHLTEGSTAIDQGDAAHSPAWLTKDADGDARVLASGSGPALLDIGWDEWTDAHTPSLDVPPALGCAPGSGGSGGSGGSAGTTAGSGGSAGTTGPGTGEGATPGDGGMSAISTAGGATSSASGSDTSGESGISGVGPDGASGEGGADGPGGAGGNRGGDERPVRDEDCGCRVAGGAQGETSTLGLGALVLGLFGWRRRRTPRAIAPFSRTSRDSQTRDSA